MRRGWWLCAFGVIASAIWCGVAAASPVGLRCSAGSAQVSTPAPGPALLEQLIDTVPCPATGTVSFGTTDNRGDQLGVLDSIPDPAGGYLGVYHSPFRRDGRQTFRVSLAHSTDLIHWTRIQVLVARNASVPTIQAISGGTGYLLAYERALPHGGGDVAVLQFYPTLAALGRGRFTARSSLPRRFSPYNNGTPTIVAVSWGGSPSMSNIVLGFHYESETNGHRGPDREALGRVIDFRRWSAWRDTGIDSELDRLGLVGNHGDWRGFTFEGGEWRVYEAQQRFDSFATWHLLLWNAATDQMLPLVLATGTASRITSVGNPIINVEPAPTGSGFVLVVSAFVFDASARADDGELVYYVPL